MDIITRIRNNMKYAHHRKLADKAIAKMEEHKDDSDNREYKKWANIALNSLTICFEVPLK